MSYLRYLCLRKVACDTYCIVFLFSLSSSCVPNVATVSLDCPFLITLSVFSNVYLSCVPNVASFSGLSISDYPSVFSNVYLQFLWIVHF